MANLNLLVITSIMFSLNFYLLDAATINIMVLLPSERTVRTMISLELAKPAIQSALDVATNRGYFSNLTGFEVRARIMLNWLSGL